MNQKKTFLIVVIGATGVGKTELSLKIAQQYGCPIISSDSRQIYKNIPIGTAAPTADERQQTEHLFVDRLPLDQPYSAAQFEREVIDHLDHYFQQHQVALMAGGSMMYIDAVCKGLDEMPSVPSELREELNHIWKTEGLEPLLKELKEKDPLHFERIDRCNHKRVIHALEMCRITGMPFSSLRKETHKQRPFQIIKVGLARPREELYERIAQRVDQMVKKGVVEEARAVYPLRHLNSLNTVGFKELFAHFDGIYTLDEAIDKIKQNSRIYSRKQTTWIRRDHEIQWFHPDQLQEIIQYIQNIICKQ